MLSHTMTQSDPHAPRGTNPPQNVVCDCPQPTYVPLQCYQPTAGYRQPGFPHAGPGFAPGPCPHMHYPQMLHPQATYYQAPFHQGPTRTEFRGDPTGEWLIYNSFVFGNTWWLSYSRSTIIIIIIVESLMLSIRLPLLGIWCSSGNQTHDPLLSRQAC